MAHRKRVVFLPEISIKSSFNFWNGIYVKIISSFLKMWSALSLWFIINWFPHEMLYIV